MTSITRRALLRAAIAAAATPALAWNLPGVAAAGRKDADVDTPIGVFRELPIGRVRPRGWLLGQLRKQAAGVTSHLQHLYAPFTGNAWTSDDPDPDGSWWPWEVRGYWCDGTLRCGLLLQDDELVEQSARLIEYTFSHPHSDGYLGPSSLKGPGDANRWPHAVFFRAAMAWHDATNDPTIVEGLRRHYLDSKFDYIPDRASTNIEAMLWTYERSGDERLLKLAQDSWRDAQNFLAQSRWTFDLTEPGMLGPGPVGGVHGVTYAELSKIPTLLYLATGDARHLQVAVSAQRKIFEHHMLVGGVPSTSEVMSTNTSRDAHETCNVSDFPWNWGYLLMASGNGMYGDRIERATFNALPGSLRKDWKALQYFSSPNQFLCTAHSNHLAPMKGTGREAIEEFRYMQRMSYRPSPGHTVVCCPANLSRTLPNYIARMWMSDPKGNGIAATLYGPCSVKTQVGDDKVDIEIQVDTDYPYSEDIRFNLQCAREVEFPLHLRIPDWCKAPTLSLNGSGYALPERNNGFVTLRRIWRPGDTLQLSLPMAIATSHWPEDGVSVERGPLVYAYPIEGRWTVVADERSSSDFPAWDLTPTGRWNYALLPENATRKPVYAGHAAGDDPWSHPPSSITVDVRQVVGWELIHATMQERAVRFTPRLPDPALLPYQLAPASQQVKLVPYASTELRLSVFPHVKNEAV